MLVRELTYVWDEGVSGFPAFHDLIPDAGISINNTFYTMRNGVIWEQNVQDEAIARNSFYSVDYPSSIEVVFNDSADSVKEFKTLGYEGDGSWTAVISTDQE